MIRPSCEKTAGYLGNIEIIMKHAAILLTSGVFLSLAKSAHADFSCADWMTEAFFGDATVQVARGCLEEGANVAERDEVGRTPLHLAAAAASDAAVVADLLRAGADPALTDTEGRRPIHVAAARARTPDILPYLVIWGSSVERELPGGRRCSWRSIARCATVPLHLAAARPDGAPYVAALLAAGSDPDLRDVEGRSALQHAARNATDEMAVAVLLQAGASVDASDFEGLTPLHSAVQRGDGAPDIIAMLLAAGASADSGDRNGTTPLIWGARHVPNSSIMAMLIEAADDPCVADDQERTALHQWDLNDNLDRDDVYWALHDRCSE